LARDCASDSRGAKRFGSVWPALKRRLATLRAAETLEDLRGAPGRLHELSHGERAGSLAMRVTANLRLVFRPDHQPRPIKPDGGLLWPEVRRISIEEIVDYHE